MQCYTNSEDHGVQTIHPCFVLTRAPTKESYTAIVGFLASIPCISSRAVPLCGTGGRAERTSALQPPTAALRMAALRMASALRTAAILKCPRGHFRVCEGIGRGRGRGL
ncbi:hypothetical protein R1flu_008400 [Riccia fluitans]|uniref:Uncharacterized protein n=1 Tax=Riccia fluitans TaxID=41844 RepID=A0ABD1YC85_9MARC